MAAQQNVTVTIGGGDSDGKTYGSAAEMWEHELKGDLDDRQSGWYGKALSYWEKQEPTVNGVLGGMEHVHPDDIKESRQFIEGIKTVGRTRSLDCGAGIGRIAKNLLCPMFATTDVMEPVEHLLEAARKDLPADKAGQFILDSMQKVQLKEKYDVIVIQWTAIYLTDDDFASFLAHCKASLNPGGIIFFKENVSTGDEFLVDKDDSSLTRSDRHYKVIFEKGGVNLVHEAFQRKWPKNLFPVKMYALQ